MTTNSGPGTTAGSGGSSGQQYWDRHARYDPLWAILSDPSKTGRQWSLNDFLETGRREISLLMYQLRGLGIEVPRDAALDFGCGVGRLTQPLAQHFERALGIDISPEMIRLAREINVNPERVSYVCNDRPDLSLLATGAFTFAYSNIVLQHVEPEAALAYLRELLRVVAQGGLLVFQLPSHLRPAEEEQAFSTAMDESAYRASIRVEGEVPREQAPGSEVVLIVSITNASDREWLQGRHGSIRLGNHWLSGSGDTMLIQDDGRSPLPEALPPRATAHVALTVTVPREAGEYQLECDVVHEGISWFADRGSVTWRARVDVAQVSTPRVDGGTVHGAGVDGVAGDAPGSLAAAATVPEAQPLTLPALDEVEEPGPLPMHGVPRGVVEELIAGHGGVLVHVEQDDRGGREWMAYRYFVRKTRVGA